MPKTALGTTLATLLILTGCGPDSTEDPQSQGSPSTSASSTAAPNPESTDPWPLEAPPEDPLGWIAEQRNRGEGATPTATAPRSSSGGVTVEVSDKDTGEDYEQAGAGLSLESTELADERISKDNPDLVRILSSMDQPTLRFGGNAVDRRFFFTDAGETPPDDWPLRPDEEITTVTPEDLERVAGLAEVTDASVIIGVNLADEDPERAASVAAHAEEAFGDRLTGIMIGNEPNGYYLGADNDRNIKDASWDEEKFIGVWEDYVKAIRKEVPDANIVGPGTYDMDWWRAVIGAEVDNSTLAVHQYPLSECDGLGDPVYRANSAPTLQNTVSAETRQRVDILLGRAVRLADEADMNTWVMETSVSACAGSNDITTTQAAALYSADYVMRAQELGVDRIGFHSSVEPCNGGAPMSVLCSSGTLQKPGEAFVPRTNGLALALVGGLPAGQFQETQIAVGKGKPTEGSKGEEVTAYAIEQEDGTTSVVVVDFRDPATAEELPVTVKLPKGISAANVSTLSGDDWTENYPATTLFDGGEPSHPVTSTNAPTTVDGDGVAMDVRGAVTPVEPGRPSVDGYGLPLLPPRLQPQVPGVEPGDTDVTTTTAPGSVSVITAEAL
ncbi:hypothetical protein EDL96_05315 [Kocuria soli]|uniref:Uncharacterized protein n=1 Tax=Kocuria soli TaxID=2485125 RepID=A0A3N4A525_9MICC|nr:hypothetical protein EDL96_05315 [Kocuria soli]